MEGTRGGRGRRERTQKEGRRRGGLEPPIFSTSLCLVSKYSLIETRTSSGRPLQFLGRFVRRTAHENRPTSSHAALCRKYFSLNFTDSLDYCQFGDGGCPSMGIFEGFRLTGGIKFGLSHQTASRPYNCDCTWCVAAYCHLQTVAYKWGCYFQVPHCTYCGPNYFTNPVCGFNRSMHHVKKTQITK